MMACGKVLVIITATLFAGLGYFMYVPLPDNVTEPWTMRAFYALMHMISKISIAGEFLGFGSALNITRAVQNWAVIVTRPTPVDDLKVTDTDFAGVKVRLYQPSGQQKNLPGMVYFHGGGFLLGSVETHDLLTRSLARELNMVVVSVEYRLAPEHPYPTPFQDCEAATAYFLKMATQFGVDPKRIAIAGDDAGGNIAAALAIFFKPRPDRGKISLVVIAYPPLQLLDFNLPSYMHRKNQFRGGLTREILVTQWLSYMGQDLRLLPYLLQNHHTSPETKITYGKYVNYTMISSKLVQDDFVPTQHDQFHNKNLSLTAMKWVLHTHLSPLLVKKLGGLPPFYIVSGEHDVVRDDSLMFVKRLHEAEVKVHHDHYDNGYHGMLSIPFCHLQLGRHVTGKMFDFIKQHL